MQDAIVALVRDVTEIETIYDYPVAELGRNLPAVVVMYQGFEQSRMTHRSFNVGWRFEISVYVAADSKRLTNSWAQVMDLAPKLLDALRADPTIGGTCWNSMAHDGEATISASGGPAQYVGHTIRLTAHTQEA